jgi:hypothetical protein
LACAAAALWSLNAASVRLVRFSWGDVPATAMGEGDGENEYFTDDFYRYRILNYYLFAFGLLAILLGVL